MRQIQTNQAPPAVGPYSQAMIAGDFIFVSGQLPIDPTTNKMIEGDMESLTLRVIDNLAAILQGENLTLESIVKMEVYLKDLSDFQAMNRAYAKRFNHPHLPARQAMQVAMLPLDAKIEISCIAYRGKMQHS